MTPTQQEELTPKKKRAVVEYLGILFAAAFLLVAISLLVKMKSIQTAHDGAKTNNATLESELAAAEERLEASTLLVLAQDAYYRGEQAAFAGYMQQLAGAVDDLSADAQAVYQALLANLS